jgi:CBS domain-containing protein
MTAVLTIRQLMSTELITLKRKDKLFIADRIMALVPIRHMPVLDEQGKLVGILTRRDFFHGALVRAFGHDAAAQKQALDAVLVEDVMTRDPITVAPDTTITEGAKLMRGRKVGCLPVVEGGSLVGIVTEADFVAYVATLKG